MKKNLNKPRSNSTQSYVWTNFKWASQPVTDKNFEQNNSCKKNAQMNPNKNYIIFNKDKQSMDLKQHSSGFFFVSRNLL